MRVRVRVRVGGECRTGRAIDLRGADVPARTVVRAVRRDDGGSGEGGTGDGDAGGDGDASHPDPLADAGSPRDRDGGPPVTVDCPDPGPVHDHAGYLHPDRSVSLRSALAAAARSRGHEAPERAALAEARAALGDVEPPEVDLSSARRRVAEAGEDAAELGERVAELRGRVRALREAGVDASAAEDELATAARRLSEAETERVAARQRLDRARTAAREARHIRSRRHELEDRVANLERAARASLAAAVHDEFAAAVDAVPGPGEAGDAPGDYDGDPVTAALAVVRVAAVAAPVVLSVRRFETPAAAARTLSAPVVVV
jgi:hypothetical protein